jgi:hypothetical protein
MSSGPMSSGDRGGSRRWPAAALLAVVAAAAAAVLATGCGSSAGHATAGSSEHPTATPSGAGSSSGIPTGTQLQALLPYHSGQPTGWKLDPAKFSTHNSGSALTVPEGLLPDSNSCVYIADTSGVNSLLQWWQVSFAQADMVREVPQAGGSTSFYSVEMLLAGFHPGYAAKQLNWVAARAKACPTYHDTANQALETTTSTVIPGLGDQAVFLSTRSKTAAQSLVDQELVVRVGNNVAGLAQNTSLGPLVSLAKLESMANLLVQILQQHPTGS